MRSNLVPIMMVLIAVGFCGAAYYYWHGGGGSKSAQPVSGVVIDKFQRAAGTEAGRNVLRQGVRMLSGQSTKRQVFYFVRVKTSAGDELDVEVSRDSFSSVQTGDTVRLTPSGTGLTLVARPTGQ